MLKFQDFLTEQDIKERSEKIGSAIDEAVFVQVANFANKLSLKKGRPVTAEELLKEVEKAIDNKNHDLSYSKAEPGMFVSGSKTIVGGSKKSWENQLRLAVSSFAVVMKHKDFQNHLKCKTGFRAIWFGKRRGQVSEPWLKRGLDKRATATSKTDIGFVANCQNTRGIFTLSLKDESGGALITSAAGETAAILEVATEDTLSLRYKPGSPSFVNHRQYIQAQIEDIERLMGNDRNVKEIQKILDDLVEHYNDGGSMSEFDGAPEVPLGEVFLRKIYKEALTAEHKFQDKPSIVSHILRMAGLKKEAKFENIDEHLSPLYNPDSDGFMFSFSRKGGHYGVGYRPSPKLGKHGQRGNQPAAFRLYPMKVAEQKAAWLQTQDEYIMNDDFDSYVNEFGYKISREDAKSRFDSRKKALDKAIRDYGENKDSKAYQQTVGYKATKDEVKRRQQRYSRSAEKAPKPAPTDYVAGGMPWFGDAERETFKLPKPEEGGKAIKSGMPEDEIRKPNTGAGARMAWIKGKPEQSKPAQERKITLPQTKTSVPKQQIKAAVRSTVRQKVQPTQKPLRAKFDWSGVEKDYTTTRDSLEDIGRRHGVDPQDIDYHVWSKKLRRPSRMQTI